MTHWNPNYKVWDTNGLYVFLLSFIRDLSGNFCPILFLCFMLLLIFVTRSNIVIGGVLLSLGVSVVVLFVKRKVGGSEKS